MSSSTSRRTARRRARREKAALQAAIEDRYDQRLRAWQAAQPAESLNAFGHGPGMPRMTRRDRERAAWHRPSLKQRMKHWEKRAARWRAQREARRAQFEALLAGELAGTGLVLQRLEHLAGSVPMTAAGTVDTPQGDGLLFTWRYRYDRAFLEVGFPDPEVPDLVGEAVLVASRDNVTGEPYEGSLPHLDAIALIGELFRQAHAPVVGERFGDRFTNTLDLLLGRGGDPELPTLIR